MPDYEEQIKELEEEIRKTQYNKATQHHIGLVKAKIAKLREKQHQRGSGGKKGEGYAVRKAGDSSVVLLGFPSVGKSTLLNKITGAESEVGSYAFTTLTVIPGIMEHEGAQIQILDVPGIVHGAASGKGRGREVLAVIRSADLIVMVLDVTQPEHLQALEKEVYDSGIRMNEIKPDIKINKKSKGGIDYASTCPQPELTEETAEGILREFGLANCEVVVRDPITADQLIDAIEGNKVYIPAITVLNKIDMADPKTIKKVKRDIDPDICVSANSGVNIEKLKDLIFEKLNLIRIYTKETGKDADMDEPLITRAESTVGDVCRKLHKDFVKNFKFARIWGPSAKFGGQKLMLDHELKDGDIVEIHVR